MRFKLAENSNMPFLRVVLGPRAVSGALIPPAGRFGGCVALLFVLMRLICISLVFVSAGVL
jgi:hypothetical protein